MVVPDLDFADSNDQMRDGSLSVRSHDAFPRRVAQDPWKGEAISGVRACGGTNCGCDQDESLES